MEFKYDRNKYWIRRIFSIMSGIVSKWKQNRAISIKYYNAYRHVLYGGTVVVKITWPHSKCYGGWIDIAEYKLLHIDFM